MSVTTSAASLPTGARRVILVFAATLGSAFTESLDLAPAAGEKLFELADAVGHGQALLAEILEGALLDGESRAQFGDTVGNLLFVAPGLAEGLHEFFVL